MYVVIEEQRRATCPTADDPASRAFEDIDATKAYLRGGQPLHRPLDETETPYDETRRAVGLRVTRTDSAQIWDESSRSSSRRRRRRASPRSGNQAKEERHEGRGTGSQPRTRGRYLQASRGGPHAPLGPYSIAPRRSTRSTRSSCPAPPDGTRDFEKEQRMFPLETTASLQRPCSNVLAANPSTRTGGGAVSPPRSSTERREHGRLPASAPELRAQPAGLRGDHVAAVRIERRRPPDREEPRPARLRVVDATDRHVEMFTRKQTIADAFVAGYDYATRQR